MRDYNLYWVEDVTTPDHLEEQAALREIIHPINLAGGEHEFTRFGFAQIAKAGALDIWQPDVAWCGGITETLRILELAQEHSVPVVPHRGGEIWGLHVIAATDCEDLAETHPERWEESADELWLDEPRVVDGYPHALGPTGLRSNPERGDAVVRRTLRNSRNECRWALKQRDARVLAKFRLRGRNRLLHGRKRTEATALRRVEVLHSRKENVTQVALGYQRAVPHEEGVRAVVSIFVSVPIDVLGPVRKVLYVILPQPVRIMFHRQQLLVEFHVGREPRPVELGDQRMCNDGDATLPNNRLPLELHDRVRHRLVRHQDRVHHRKLRIALHVRKSRDQNIRLPFDVDN